MSRAIPAITNEKISIMISMNNTGIIILKSKALTNAITPDHTMITPIKLDGGLRILN